ncbi:Phosphoglycolate phosphatase, HAD superfamily [Actinokineospora alba]|uniref:Phosphoglycolate phosphatase, HAD superfamily n=1 Tax=Actinokineospora alba TaxID=504798 RepID=A0A1H0FDN8_9PSEU|nr:HAD family hydrolase [Actinokineospora alba]TDP69435.1 phosphoglycolate phosphatase-like HAD superfamily hydrolase [Actinokineospora alba]SDI16857.1 Phosphoglycolate phosphatase, HAD superfamily [Actinokineospora alba]SDN92642.1 Phosphoglycolate phosphatase, HAD superfamily [Actinokineospora alba]
MSTLIVFDIDGTLLRSVAPHQEAFIGALRDSGLDDIDSAWGGYAHHTDSWIFREVFRRNTGALPTEAQTQFFSDRLHERFVAGTERDGVAQIPGAAAFLRKLAESPEYTVAFATGGMREVTAVKLAPLDAVGPVATASEHTFREHVVREAIHQAGGPFDRVVAVGDGPWDVRAAVATGSQFIGIGETVAPFGDWFPTTHLFTSFDDVDPAADFTLTPPPGQVTADPDTDDIFAARPLACRCWA